MVELKLNTKMSLTSMPYDDQLEIKQYPGNDRCVECGDFKPTWAAVNYGILVCLSCAGKHRSLGVAVSYIKSLEMDSWSDKHIMMMKMGGNGKWAAVALATDIASIPCPEKYETEVALLYRKRVEQSIADEKPFSVGIFLNSLNRDSRTITTSSVKDKIKEDIHVKSKQLEQSKQLSPCVKNDNLTIKLEADQSNLHQSDSTNSSNEEFCIKCTLCQKSIPIYKMDSHSNTCQITPAPLSSSSKGIEYEVSLGNSNDISLGLSLTKAKDGSAFVSYITPGGSAEQNVVSLGSIVLEINGEKPASFRDTIDKAKTSSRPIVFRFRTSNLRKGKDRKRRSSRPSSVPEPVMIKNDVTFQSTDLGFTYDIINDKCIVQSVQPDGEAAKNGILVGYSIIGTDNKDYLPSSMVKKRIDSKERPLMLKFSCVEGLTRNWKQENGCNKS